LAGHHVWKFFLAVAFGLLSANMLFANLLKGDQIHLPVKVIAGLCFFGIVRYLFINLLLVFFLSHFFYVM
jgi:hypothetical protein